MFKKGQITIFLIIGLIILISAGIIIYLMKTTSQISSEEALIPEEAKPIYNYVTNCMNVLSQEALALMANQGGYLHLPNKIAKTPASYLRLDPQGMLKVPYWYYQGENRIPTIAGMQQEISQYVQERLSFCTKEFSDFAQYTVKEENAPAATTLFTDEDVTIKVTWPLTISLEGRSFSVKDYTTAIPVRYKKIYDLAKQILMEENKETFFENLTMDLFTANADIPFDGMEMSCKQKKWRLADIERSAQEILRQAIAQVRIKNTIYPPFLEDESAYEELAEKRAEIQQQLEETENDEEINNIKWEALADGPLDRYDYFHYLWDMGAPESNLKIHFAYNPAWDMHLNAHPNSNGVLSSNNINQFSQWLRLLCINQYHFTYDIIYPVMVTLSDDQSYNGQGYNFRFAFPVIIHYNKPARETFSDQQFTDYSAGADFCEESGAEYYALKAIGYDEYGYPGELSKVNVSYECLGNTCNLGMINAQAGENRLYTQIPSSCANPYIVMEKKGYVPARAQLTEQELTLQMLKLRPLQIAIRKLPYLYQGEDTQGFLAEENLKLQDSATLYLKHKDSDHEIFYEYPNEENNSMIELIDDDSSYEADITLTSLGNLVGGYHSENLTISYADLARAQEITFYVLESRPLAPELPAYQERLIEQIYSENHNEALTPRFT